MNFYTVFVHFIHFIMQCSARTAKNDTQKTIFDKHTAEKCAIITAYKP